MLGLASCTGHPCCMGCMSQDGSLQLILRKLVQLASSLDVLLIEVTLEEKDVWLKVLLVLVANTDNRLSLEQTNKATKI
jgi:hypothetical protein